VAIMVGTLRTVVLPSPSWPEPFAPQVTNTPSLRMAALWLSPAAIALA
jgi:hypothetical protein